jgi:hypothetical protein
MRILQLASFFVLMVGGSVSARDIFVNNVLGDDRRGGTTVDPRGESGGPCRSISKALRIALPGDRIVVANTGQPYREGLTVQGPRHSGSERFPTTIEGNGAVLDGTMSLAEAFWEYAGQNTFRTRPQAKSHQQLFLDGQPVARKQPAAGAPIVLAPLQWCLFDGWIYFRPEEGKLPVAYDLACCGEQVGITLYEVHDVVIQDLHVRGFWLDGVNCHDGVRDTEITRVTASDNGRSGFSVGGACRVAISGCMAGGNGAAQVRTEGYCIVRMQGNQLDSASAPALVREGGTVIGEE